MRIGKEHIHSKVSANLDYLACTPSLSFRNKHLGGGDTDTFAVELGVPDGAINEQQMFAGELDSVTLI